VIAPLTMSFDVACSARHAFDMWTSGIGAWWPADHTVTGRPDVVVVLQGGVGGRIFERTAAGVEHDWGEVVLWDPPARLAYLWHLRQDPADSTEVEIRFVDLGGRMTRVEIEHRGWERLGHAADEAQFRNRAGWDSLLPHYLSAIARGDN
jgi:uncharacterized protein YndB with AHSA1/START domain